MAYLKDKKHDGEHTYVGPSFGPMVYMLSLLLRLGVLAEERTSVIRNLAGIYARYE